MLGGFVFFFIRCFGKYYLRFDFKFSVLGTGFRSLCVHVGQWRSSAPQKDKKETVYTLTIYFSMTMSLENGEVLHHKWTEKKQFTL
jgi:hypothetical protein